MRVRLNARPVFLVESSVLFVFAATLHDYAIARGVEDDGAHRGDEGFAGVEAEGQGGAAVGVAVLVPRSAISDMAMLCGDALDRMEVFADFAVDGHTHLGGVKGESKL